MSNRLHSALPWNRARAAKLHEHFQVVAMSVACGGRIGVELERAARMLDGLTLHFQGGEMLLQASCKTLRKFWDRWNKGGPEGEENAKNVRRPEALLCNYKPGCGGHRAMPRELVREFQRRCTLVTGGRNKHGRSNLSDAWKSIQRDYQLQRPLPGVSYEGIAMGAEIPWSTRTMNRKKPARDLRALANMGASAAKAVSAFVRMNYSELRKCEGYTLDDVRLDIVCMHEATGEAVGAVCYILIEMASRCIVGFVIKPCVPDASEGVRRKSITQDDVAELLAYGLQAPGFGIGVDYATHILFERGTTACSPALKSTLEGMTNIRVHLTGMVGGVRWIGSARDQAKGNSMGKGVIESFNRRLHAMLLHLPGQRGNHAQNEPQNMGVLGKPRYRFDGKGNGRQNGGTTIDEDEQLAQLNLATGGTMKLRLNHLFFRELKDAVAEAIAQHNAEPGHEYQGHRKHWQTEVAPGLWRDAGDVTGDWGMVDGEEERAEIPSTDHESPITATPVKTYVLKGTAGDAWIGGREASIYWKSWSQVAQHRPDLDRHSITRRVLGANVPHKQLTRPQWAKLLSAFRQIASEARAANPI